MHGTGGETNRNKTKRSGKPNFVAGGMWKVGWESRFEYRDTRSGLVPGLCFIENDFIQSINYLSNKWDNKKNDDRIKSTRLTAFSCKEGNDVWTSIYA